MGYRQDPVLIAPDGIATSETFGQVDIQKARKVTFIFTRADDAGGSGVFSIEGSLDGETFVTVNMLIDNVTNSNSQTLTRVASATLANETSKVYALDLENFNFSDFRIKVVRTTSGTHSYKALIEY